MRYNPIIQLTLVAVITALSLYARSARATEIDWGAFWDPLTGSGEAVIDGTTVTIESEGYSATNSTQPDLNITEDIPSRWKITFSRPVNFSLGFTNLGYPMERINDFSVAPTNTVIGPHHTWDGSSLGNNSWGAGIEISTLSWTNITSLTFFHRVDSALNTTLILKDASFTVVEGVEPPPGAAIIDWGAFWGVENGAGTTVIDGTTVTISSGNYHSTIATQPHLHVGDSVPSRWTITFSRPVDFSLGIADLSSADETVQQFSIAPTDARIHPNHGWDGSTLGVGLSGSAPEDISTLSWGNITSLSFSHSHSEPDATLTLRDGFFLVVLAPEIGIVSNSDDSGPGSLRWAIDVAPPGSTITFAPRLSGATITQGARQLTINKDLTIDASELDHPITIDANGAITDHRVLQVTADAVVILDSLNLIGGKTPQPAEGDSDDGGGVHNAGTMTIRNATISGNGTGLGTPWQNGNPDWDPNDPNSPPPEFTWGDSGRGGGIYNTGTLTLQNTTITNNSTGLGALMVGGGSGDGAGIWNSGTLVVEQCTISDNRAPGFGGGAGGGFYNRGTLTIENSSVINNSSGNGKLGINWAGAAGDGGGGVNTGDLTLRNVTISGNAAGYGGSGGGGGGCYNSGTLTVENSTITNNHSREGGEGGGLLNTGPGFLTLENSIVAGNNTFPNVRDDNGNLNLVSNNITTGDPMLSPLGFYGGPTQTMPPLPDSPAFDAGTPTANTPATDQRGLPRIAGAGLDIGSCELAVRLRSLTGLARTSSEVRLSIKGFHPGIGVEYSPDLSHGSWIDLGNFFYDHDRGEMTFIDPDPVRRIRRSGFYRGFLRTNR